MNKGDRRNPYVILGLRFGASESEARSAFARAKRRLRKDPSLPYTQEDLTWALHQVEQIISNPELALDIYRIPAGELPEPAGVFNPPPHRLPRTTSPADAHQLEELRRAALASVLRKALAEVVPEQGDFVPYDRGEES